MSAARIAAARAALGLSADAPYATHADEPGVATFEVAAATWEDAVRLGVDGSSALMAAGFPFASYSSPVLPRDRDDMLVFFTVPVGAA